MSKFNSAIEEALALAYETRRSIIEGNVNLPSILLTCSIVALNTKKEEDSYWIYCELNGYTDLSPFYKDKTPSYREITVRSPKVLGKTKAIKYEILADIYKVEAIFKKNTPTNVEIHGERYIFPKSELANLLLNVRQRCFYFLDSIQGIPIQWIS